MSKKLIAAVLAGGLMLLYGVGFNRIKHYSPIIGNALVKYAWTGISGTEVQTHKNFEFSNPDRSIVENLEIPIDYEQRLNRALSNYNKRPDGKKNLDEFFKMVKTADIADTLPDNRTNEAGANTLCSFLEGVPANTVLSATTPRYEPDAKKPKDSEGSAPAKK